MYINHIRGWEDGFSRGSPRIYANICHIVLQLSKSLYKQIQSVLTRFWWDVKPEIRKMSWVSWDKLTLPKGAEGLGFKEIEIFNDALLAKHTWRFLQNPDSLLGKTLLNKYCRAESILECSAPNSVSHGLRDILAGCELLKKGIGWVIGDGKSVTHCVESELDVYNPATMNPLQSKLRTWQSMTCSFQTHQTGM